MNFTERLDRLFESTDYHVHIDRGEGSAEIQCRDDGGFLLTRLVVQNFEVPEADVFVGNGDALHTYRSFSRQEDFWQYAHNLKRDIETLAQVAAGCRVAIYRTIFLEQRKSLRYQKLALP